MSGNSAARSSAIAPTSSTISLRSIPLAVSRTRPRTTESSLSLNGSHHSRFHRSTGVFAFFFFCAWAASGFFTSGFFFAILLTFVSCFSFFSFTPYIFTGSVKRRQTKRKKEPELWCRASPSSSVNLKPSGCHGFTIRHVFQCSIPLPR